MREAFRCPACRRCLRAPEPRSAEYSCVGCRSPFQNAIALDSDSRIKALAGLPASGRPLVERVDAVGTLPWRCRRKRGFKQSEPVARARRTGVTPLKARPSGARYPRTQAGPGNHTRPQSVTRAFRARPMDRRTVLLMDDAMTIVSTAAACALKRAGARRVAVWTIARADRRLYGRRLVPFDSMVGGIDHA